MGEELFRDGRLLTSKLARLPGDPTRLPPGWMSSLELTLLYNLALKTRGDILEIGSWVGRSTAAIAMGIRDSGVSPRSFDVVDLGITSVAEFVTALKTTNSEYLLKDEVTRPILQPGGVIGGLIENLRQRDLLRFTTAIIRGDAAAVPLRAGYEVVFCDATHTVAEIAIVGPVLARVTKPGTWLMCDDVTDTQLLAALSSHVALEFVEHLSALDGTSKSIVGRVGATAAA